MEARVPDFLHIIVTKQDVLARNTQPTIDSLLSLLQSPETALKWRERVDISFDGYNESQWELFEIPEVRDFVYHLDESFPYWLFFLSKAHFGLQCIMLCFLPPFLTPEAQANTFPDRIRKLFEDRWGPAMCYVCEFTGMTGQQVDQMTDRFIEYIKAG
jgi:hypothetical protein